MDGCITETQRLSRCPGSFKSDSCLQQGEVQVCRWRQKLKDRHPIDLLNQVCSQTAACPMQNVWQTTVTMQHGPGGIERRRKNPRCRHYIESRQLEYVALKRYLRHVPAYEVSFAWMVVHISFIETSPGIQEWPCIMTSF